MPVTHQNVRLARGKHHSPEEGACAMELASMLAGERFTDRPHCVSPVIGAFLRSYNDLVDAPRRDDLRRCAAVAVGTRADARLERTRLQMCRAHIVMLQVPWLTRRRIDRAVGQLIASDTPLGRLDMFGWLLARAHTLDPWAHQFALDLVDILAALSRDPAAEARPPAVPDTAAAGLGC
jgi:hypothetical protein